MECDHGHCTDKEVRLLPYGGGGNIIVCHKHYLIEISYRRKVLRVPEHLIPTWESLKVYKEE